MKTNRNTEGFSYFSPMMPKTEPKQQQQLIPMAPQERQGIPSLFENGCEAPSLLRGGFADKVSNSANSAIGAINTSTNAKAPGQVVQKYFEAFQQGDWKTMSKSYAPDATFQDPIFPKGLKGNQIGAAWGDITQNIKPKITFSDIKVDGDTVTAKWNAKYQLDLPLFGKNAIDNDITATFKIKDGKIVDHKEHFDLNEYMREATGMGPFSFLMRPVVRPRLRSGALENMNTFLNKHQDFFKNQ